MSSATKSYRVNRPLKGHSQLWNRADLDFSLSHFDTSSPQPEIKVHLEFRFNLHSVLLDFQSFTEESLFECVFTHPITDFHGRVMFTSFQYGRRFCGGGKQFCNDVYILLSIKFKFKFKFKFCGEFPRKCQKKSQFLLTGRLFL